MNDDKRRESEDRRKKPQGSVSLTPYTNEDLRGHLTQVASLGVKTVTEMEGYVIRFRNTFKER